MRIYHIFYSKVSVLLLVLYVQQRYDFMFYGSMISPPPLPPLPFVMFSLFCLILMKQRLHLSIPTWAIFPFLFQISYIRFSFHGYISYRYYVSFFRFSLLFRFVSTILSYPCTYCHIIFHPPPCLFCKAPPFFFFWINSGIVLPALSRNSQNPYRKNPHWLIGLSDTNRTVVLLYRLFILFRLFSLLPVSRYLLAWFSHHIDYHDNLYMPPSRLFPTLSR